MLSKIMRLMLLCSVFLAVASVAGAWQRSSNCVEGNGEFAEQQRELKNFQRVAVQGAYTIVITLGQEYRCTLNGDSNLLEHVVSQVADGQLRIGNDTSLCMKQPLQIFLQLPQLDGFYAEGAHEIRLEQLTGKRFDLELQGANLAQMSGTVDQLQVKIGGTSALDASTLSSVQAQVEATGTTSSKVQVSQRLTVTASGIAEVLYSGQPQQIETQLSGLADVTSLK